MRTPRILATAIVVFAVGGCSSTMTVPASGRVDDATITLTTPLIGSPRVNLDAGFAPTGPHAQQQQSPPMPLRVATSVLAGTRVRAGDVVVQFDTATLDMALAQAKADLAVAAAQPAVLSDRLTELTDKRTALLNKRDELRTARNKLAAVRRDLDDALTKLPEAKAQLSATIDDLTTKRTALVATEAKLKASFDALPSDQQTTAQGTTLTAKLNEVKGTLAQLDTGRATAQTKLGELAANLKKASTALADVRAKQQQVRDGLDAIDDGLQQLVDARALLDAAKVQADIAVYAAEIVCEQAAQRRNLATITAPSEGIVVDSPNTGDVLLPGASMVILRTDPLTATVWVEDTSRLSVGAAAGLTSDAADTVQTTTVKRIGTSTVIPPSAYAAHGLHTTRATPITLALTAPLPAGLPVTASITPYK